MPKHNNQINQGLGCAEPIIQGVMRATPMNAEVLLNPPISGEFDEYLFDATGNCIFVRFDDDPELPWVGVFGQGDYGKSRVANSGKFSFVLSRGKIYYLNRVEKSVIYTSDTYHLHDVVAISDNGSFIAACDLYLYLFDLNGKNWTSERISWDGIRKLSCIEDRIRGERWDAMNQKWGTFIFNITTKECSEKPLLSDA